MLSRLTVCLRLLPAARVRLLAAAISLLAGPNLSAKAAAEETTGNATPPPNIVFILADDLGIMDINAFARRYAAELGANDLGERFYETPHLDRLVRDGVAFSQAYANQLCSPTRAAILTGRFPARIGFTTATPNTRTYYNQATDPPPGRRPHDAFAHRDKIDAPQAWLNGASNTALPTDVPTLPAVLASHDCAYLGKWHVGGHGAAGRQPRDFGFEELAYYDAGGSPYFGWRPLWQRRRPFYKTMPQRRMPIGRAGPPTPHDYLTDDLAAQAAAYLKERAARPDKPFCLYYAPFAVHTPLQAPAPLVARFDAKPRRDGDRRNATYAAMVERLDASVGTLVDTLQATGLAGRTLVVFFSDNGGVEYTDPAATDNAPFKGGKACLHEGGVRVPLVFRMPGGAGGGRWCDAPVNCVDLLPTLADVTGNAPPAGADGVTLAPLLEGVEEDDDLQAPPRVFYWHYPFNVIVRHPDLGLPLTPHSAIRVGSQKLIWDWHGGLELYDIPNDPFEKENLAAAQPERAAELLARLQAWLRENVAEQYFPTRNPGYDATDDPRGSLIDRWNQPSAAAGGAG